MSKVTQALDELEAGDPQAAGRLLELVYQELRTLAAQRLSGEPAGHTLQPTALVHEAFLRVGGPDGQRRFENRSHFFAAAAEAMRRILIDHARSRRRRKRGGDRDRTTLPDMPDADADSRLLELDAALTRLAEEDAIAARCVELRYFSGLGHEAIAETLEISVYQARQKWTYARAWLTDELGEE